MERALISEKTKAVLERAKAEKLGERPVVMPLDSVRM